MIVISCSHGVHLGKSIAKKAGFKHSELFVSKFPDNELLVRLNINVKNQNVVFIQSFYGEISDCIIELILAASTAKELGAKKIMLAAPYFPYIRQDKRFHPGESVSQKIIAELVEGYFDSILIVDPHLHRKSSLREIFNIKPVKLSANSSIADYIKNKIKNPVIIGPDSESYKWAQNVAESIEADFRILEKKRYSSYHVEVKLNKKIDLKNKNVVIVDDIVSTGHTIIETSRLLRKLGAKSIYCICVHGIFAGNALKKFRKNKIKVVSTNTIPNRAAKISVAKLISKNLINH
jgi:ribose-phosphate pyrophosphokinase